LEDEAMSFDTYDLDRAVTNEFGSYAWGEAQHYDGRNLPINGVDYTFEYVDSDYGDYDYSSQMWVVFKVDGQAYRKTGFYQSHYGSEWDGRLEKVTPREVTKIEWDAA
jgi:hypothetical protein